MLRWLEHWRVSRVPSTSHWSKRTVHSAGDRRLTESGQLSPQPPWCTPSASLCFLYQWPSSSPLLYKISSKFPFFFSTCNLLTLLAHSWWRSLWSQVVLCVRHWWSSRPGTALCCGIWNLDMCLGWGKIDYGGCLSPSQSPEPSINYHHEGRAWTEHRQDIANPSNNCSLVWDHISATLHARPHPLFTPHQEAKIDLSNQHLV